MNAPVLDGDCADLEDLFDSIAAARPAPLAAASAAALPAPAEPAGEQDMVSRIGHMTRTLHDSMRELGYDKVLEKAAASIPDARDRLSYVATMTEQAAQRVLTATEAAGPIQDRLESDAERLASGWNRLHENQLSVDEFRQLAGATREYLAQVPERTRATRAHLTEIMMAQDFQDLTGQVIKKITETAQALEQQLVRLLLDNLPPERRAEVGQGLMNGPVIDASGRSDVVTSQGQVDDLLESLGF